VSDRDNPPATLGDPRRTLESWLDFQRTGVGFKIEGLSEHDARRQLVTSPTTVLGIVRHLRVVEQWWFQGVLAGLDVHPFVEYDEWILDEQSFESALDASDEECAASRVVQASLPDLSTLARHHDFSHVDYAWLLGHLIEETARHLGHLDVLVEQLSGRRGM